MTPQRTIGHYRITAKLGEGGMGEVWRAVDTKLNREVAIKVLPEAFANDADRLARFTREAQVLASLNHPNIAAIYGVEDRALVMELVDGPTLADRIAAGPIPLDEALPIAKQMAEGLEYAHDRGVIHRDLKPANVKITPEGRVKVLDFGLAKAISSEQQAEASATVSPTLTMRATQMGVIMGTAAYMSPEQAKGKPVDKRADIWAFGVVLTEMLTGRQLYTGDTISETLAAVLLKDPDLATLPAGTPASIRRLLRRCLDKDAQRRLRDIGEARIAIEAPAEESAPASVAPSRSVAPWILAAVLALALVAVSTIRLREKPSQPSVVQFQVPPPEGASAFGFLALSPDGRRLAFSTSSKASARLMWVRALDSLESHPLPGAENPYFPFWSPDSRYLAFWSEGKLKKIDPAGGPPQTLCVSDTRAGGYWNADGMIYFGGISSGIFRVPQAGGEPIAVTKLDPSRSEVGHAFPQVLVDGRHFLYLNIVTSGNSAIYLRSFDGKENRRLLATRQSFRYAPPSEADKPGHVLFLREGTLMAQPVDPKTFEVAGDAFPVVDRVGYALNNAMFTVSGSGVLAYRSGDTGADQQLTWFDRSGKSIGTVGGRANYASLSLSRDGTHAAVQQTDPQTGNRDLWLIDLTRRSHAFHVRGASWRPGVVAGWQPDCVLLLPRWSI